MFRDDGEDAVSDTEVGSPHFVGATRLVRGQYLLMVGHDSRGGDTGHGWFFVSDTENLDSGTKSRAIARLVFPDRDGKASQGI